jgi:Flp pilus assembly secretin CpaC
MLKNIATSPINLYDMNRLLDCVSPPRRPCSTCNPRFSAAQSLQPGAQPPGGVIELFTMPVLNAAKRPSLRQGARSMSVRAFARLLSAPVLLAAPVVAALVSPAAATERVDTVAVSVDHARVIRLPERTQTVVIGNPAIADVTVQRNGVLIVTGKSFGVTNLIALDAAGAMVAESRVSVRAATDSVVTVQRGSQE